MAASIFTLTLKTPLDRYGQLYSMVAMVLEIQANDCHGETPTTSKYSVHGRILATGFPYCELFVKHNSRGFTHASRYWKYIPGRTIAVDGT